MRGNVAEEFDTDLEQLKRALRLQRVSPSCAKKTLEESGFKDIRHIRVTDLDLEKGKSPAVEINVRKVVEKAKQELAS